MQLRKLPTLIAVVDSLERRLCGGRVLSEDVLSDQELLDLLQMIGQQYVNSFTLNPLAVWQLQLEDEVQQLLTTNANKRILSIRHTALLRFTEVVFQFIRSSGCLHPHVYSIVQGLQFSFFRALLIDPGVFIEPDYPYMTLLNLLVDTFVGYDQYSGRRAQALLREAGRRVVEIVASNDAEEGMCAKIELEFAALVSNYNRESYDIYEKSLITREHGDAARDDVRAIVNREILMAVGGRSLPVDLLRFFQDVWGKYLHVTYLREGPSSLAWKEGISVIPIVVRSLYINDFNEMYHFYTGELSRALAILHEGTGSIQQDSQLTSSVLAYLDELPVDFIQKGKKPDLSVFQDVPLPTKVRLPSIDDLTVLDGLQIGNWCVIRTGEQEIRGKLIQKDTALGYCLFANYSGMKAARLEIVGLAKALADGSIRSIENNKITANAMERALIQLESQVKRLKSKVLLAEQERARVKTKAQESVKQLETVTTPKTSKSGPPIVVQETVADVNTANQQPWPTIAQQPAGVEEDAAKLKRLREEIRREESESREQERKVAEAQARAREQAEREEQERVLKRVIEDVGLLQPGGWVELLVKDNVKQTCKLGLKIKSTQKMIFVDRFGQKVAEMKANDFAARIVEGSARIIDHGVTFEDTLQSLIYDRSGKADG